MTVQEGESTANVDRTVVIAEKLKALYKKSILPVEKKYRYDYFFESPLLSDIEFDGTCPVNPSWMGFCKMLASFALSFFRACVRLTLFSLHSLNATQPSRRYSSLDSIRSERRRSSAIF